MAVIAGTRFDRYEIISPLGAGGMGQVYLARQCSLKREVALKLLRNDLNANPTALARFQAEAQAVAKPFTKDLFYLGCAACGRSS